MNYVIYLLHRDGKAADADPMADATDLRAASTTVERMIPDLDPEYRIEVYQRHEDGSLTLVNRYEPPKVEGSQVMSVSGPEVKLGIYEYKGKLYHLLGLAQVHSTQEVMVAYAPLYTDARHVGPPIHLRQVGEFLERFVYKGSYL